MASSNGLITPATSCPLSCPLPSTATQDSGVARRSASAIAARVSDPGEAAARLEQFSRSPGRPELGEIISDAARARLLIITSDLHLRNDMLEPAEAAARAASELAELPDERLIRLLELRPDLAQPPPGSISALAARAQARQSVKAATDELDFLHLAVLDALLVLHTDTAPVPASKLVELVADRAPEDVVIRALDDLRDRALAWVNP